MKAILNYLLGFWKKREDPPPAKRRMSEQEMRNLKRLQQKLRRIKGREPQDGSKETS